MVEREWRVCRKRAAVVGNVVAGSAGLCCVAEDAAGADAAGVVHGAAIAAAAGVLVVAVC